MAEPSAPRIFLSYSKEDVVAVSQLYNRLKQAGYRPWMDKKDLLPGQNWRYEIPRVIKSSALFIVCLSQRSIIKRGYVQQEFRLALMELAQKPSDKIYLIPLRLDDFEIPDLRYDEYGISLRDYQWLDYFKDDGFKRLLQAFEYAKIPRLNPLKIQVTEFLKNAGAAIHNTTDDDLLITDISNLLKPYVPLPVSITSKQPNEQDVSKLAARSKTLTEQKKFHVGILIYGEFSEDTFQKEEPIFRMRITEVRLRDRCVVIPIPLLAIQRALFNKQDVLSSGVLLQFARGYLPGNDLFDNRNAIGDTLSFFGRRDLLNQLEDSLLNNQSIGLFGLRKSGKTSLLLQLSYSMRRHPIVHIDLQPHGNKTRYGNKLFKIILQRLLQLASKPGSEVTLNLKIFEDDLPASDLAADFAQLMGVLVNNLQEDYELPILCFLDEVERIFPTPNDSRERAEEFNAFFGVLRALSQEQQFLSLLVADAHPDCNRINHWPQPGVVTNPVFNFFKEVFVPPFPIEDTVRMVTDVGSLMEVEFDRETLEAIHKESGGHPFVARQLASLLHNEIMQKTEGKIQWSAAKKYLNKSLRRSGVLKDYFKQNIWADLEQHGFSSAMVILQFMACNEELNGNLAEQVIFQQLSPDFTESDCLDALIWLEAVGLVRREEKEDQDNYYIQVPLLSRWLQMHMTQEEIQQWKLEK